MEIYSDVTIAGHKYKKGDSFSWIAVYPTMLFIVLVYTATNFFLVYHAPTPSILTLYFVGLLTGSGFVLIYYSIFGPDDVKWMFINALLGGLGIYTQLEWVLSLINVNPDKFPWPFHVVPFAFIVLLTFLLRQAFLDLFSARENETRGKVVDFGYVVITVVIYLTSYYVAN